MAASRYRSNLITICKVMNSIKLTDCMIDQLKRTPFWLLIDSIHQKVLHHKLCKKSIPFMDKLLSSYNKDSHKFSIRNTEVQITDMDMRLIFGIRDGPNVIEDPPKGKAAVVGESDFITRTLRKGISIQRKNELTTRRISDGIEDALRRSVTKEAEKAEQAEDLARLMTLYLLDTLFLTRRSGSLSWHYVTYVEDVEQMCSYNWSSHICETLLKSMKDNADDHGKMSGCLMALPVSLYSHL